MDKKPHGYWNNINVCSNEALLYNSRNEFCEKSNGAYIAATKNNWLDIICIHMKPKGNKYKRCVYSYEFIDDCVYVGLTYNLDNRHTRHMNSEDSAVTIHINETGLQPSLKQLTEYIDVTDAIKLENYYVKFYIEKKHIILNRIKTGGLGSNTIKWDKEKCHEEALKYTTKSEYQKKSSSSYNSAHKNKWIEYVCSHMEEIKKPNGYWTFEKCQEEALKYNTRMTFKNRSENGAYSASVKNEWLDSICEHMAELRKPNGYWNDINRCKNESLKYNNKNDFFKYSRSAYKASIKNKWLDDVCSHMIKKRKPNGYWTFNKCEEEAMKYSNRSEYKNKSCSAYSVSKENNWLKLFFPKK